MTNKPMLSVERELLLALAEPASPKERVSIKRHERMFRLRGLLNKQSCGACGSCTNGCKLDRESPAIELADQHQVAPVAEVNEGDDGLFIEFIYGENGNPLKRGDKLYLRPSEQPAPVAAVLPERSSQDYAIEHAEYMAQSADDVLAKFQAYGLALLAIDEGGDDGEGELFEAIDTARGDLQESLVDLRGMVYEFRKRSSRCTSL